MRRREFITALGGAATLPFAARSQQSLPVLGHLALSSPDNPSGPFPAVLSALKQAGFEVGLALRIEARYELGAATALAISGSSARAKLSAPIGPTSL